MSKTLSEVLADIFTYYGGILERTDEGYMEFLAPSDLARAIGMPEHGKLTFEYNLSDENTVYASYDSDLFKLIGDFLSRKDKFAVTNYDFNITNAEKLSKVVSGKTLFSNAISRFETVERKKIGYLLVCFKFTALSDEKQEGLFSLLFNELNHSVTSFDAGIDALFLQLKKSDTQTRGTSHISMDTLKYAHAAASVIVKENLGDFIKSIGRRLNRDIKRIYEYYETLKHEIEKTIDERTSSNEYVETNEKEKLLHRIEAIELERKWKIQDMISKYALNIKLEPVLAIRIMVEVPVFWIHIKRRLLSREFPYTYNPILKQFDNLPCESCFYPHGGYYVCDDKLHIVCADCFKKCPDCGKHYCAACHKNGCPKCKIR